MAPNLQLTGGAFQDGSGNPLTGGTLVMQLSHDAQFASGNAEILGGIPIVVRLDNSGNIPTSPATFVYSNDVLTPTGTYYVTQAYKADGTAVWRSSQNFSFSSSPNPLNVGTIVPSNPLPPPSSSGGGTSITLQTNGVTNTTQTKLNLIQGTGITLTADAVGGVTITNSQTPSIVWDFATWAFQTTNGGFGPFLWTFSSTFVSSSSVVATTTQFPGVQFKTGAINPSLNGLWFSANAGPFFKFVSRFRFNAQVNQLTSTRTWWGFGPSGGSSASIWETDTLAVNFVGFRFSTHAGDTTWQCYCSNGSAATVVNSGVTVDTNAHIFDFIQTAGTIQYYIDNSLVGTISTNIPTGQMGPTFTIDNVATITQPSENLFYWRGIMNY